MKYIKIYEDFDDDDFCEEIENFCNTRLAYLVDEDFIIDCEDGGDDVHISISKNEPFKWGEIRDHILPFMEILDNEYGVYDHISVTYEYYDYRNILQNGENVYTVEDFINERMTILDKDILTVEMICFFKD